MNQFNHRQKPWLAKFVQRFREFFLALEMFILNKGLHQERLSQRLLLTPKTGNTAFSWELKNISLEKKCALENWKLVLRPLEVTPVFLWAPSSISVSLQTAAHHLQHQLFLWDSLKSVPSFGSCKLMGSSKMNQIYFSGLVEGSIYYWFSDQTVLT